MNILHSVLLLKAFYEKISSIYGRDLQVPSFQNGMCQPPFPGIPKQLEAVMVTLLWWGATDFSKLVQMGFICLQEMSFVLC